MIRDDNGLIQYDLGYSPGDPCQITQTELEYFSGSDRWWRWPLWGGRSEPGSALVFSKLSLHFFLDSNNIYIRGPINNIKCYHLDFVQLFNSRVSSNSLYYFSQISKAPGIRISSPFSIFSALGILHSVQRKLKMMAQKLHSLSFCIIKFMS